MCKSLLSIALLGLTAFTGAVFADAPLKTALDLTVEQARQVDEIQATHRLRYAEQRGKTNTEERKLRRARIANDSQQIAILEKSTEEMKAELRKVKESEDAAIRDVLTPEQNTEFDAYIEQREAMVGSSRDVRNHGELKLPRAICAQKQMALAYVRRRARALGSGLLQKASTNRRTPCSAGGSYRM